METNATTEMTFRRAAIDCAWSLTVRLLAAAAAVGLVVAVVAAAPYWAALCEAVANSVTGNRRTVLPPLIVGALSILVSFWAFCVAAKLKARTKIVKRLAVTVALMTVILLVCMVVILWAKSDVWPDLGCAYFAGIVIVFAILLIASLPHIGISMKEFFLGKDEDPPVQ